MSDTTSDRPGPIHARPVPHPGRWIAVVVILVLVAMMVSSFVTNPRWDFPFALRVMNYNPILEGLIRGTLVGTAGAMVLGVGLGVVVGVMRLSTNPVLRGVAFAYTWFFRAIPRYVLLTLLGTGLGYLYGSFDIGAPFGQQIAKLLGLSSGKTMRRVVLPQAMRVIVPPTGNETIAMVKDTSLLIALPVTNELFFQAEAIGSRTLKIMPTIVAATAWYLIVCSVLMVGQYFLERRFGRGFGQTSPGNRMRFLKIGADH